VGRLQQEKASQRNLTQTQKYACKAPSCNCLRTFGRKSDLARHQRSISGNPPGWRCGDCYNKRIEKSFHRKDHLVQHLRASHKATKSSNGYTSLNIPWMDDSSSTSLLFSTEASLNDFKIQNHGYLDGGSYTDLLTPENCW
jgi:hypothetical protein